MYTKRRTVGHHRASDNVFRRYASEKAATEFANADQLVTFGIVPTAAETGYGYIKRGQRKELNSGVAYQVAQFVDPSCLQTNQ